MILFPGALGDLVLATGAFAAIRERHAGAHVTLAVRSALREIAATSGVADAIASLDDADAIGLFAGADPPAWFGERPRLHAWLGTRDAEVRARLRALAERAELFAVIRDDGPEHAAVAYARQVGAGDPERRVPWPAMLSTARADELLGTIDRPVLAVHAGAGSRTKRWAADGFAGVAARWHDAGGAVVEIVGPADRDLPAIAGAHRITDWPLSDLASLLARVDVFVGNDSGVSHLAGAVGARGIAVFGPTPARRWAPRTDTIVALQAVGPFSAGIPLQTLTIGRAWRALARCGCLDKLRTRK